MQQWDPAIPWPKTTNQILPIDGTSVRPRTQNFRGNKRIRANDFAVIKLEGRAPRERFQGVGCKTTDAYLAVVQVHEFHASATEKHYVARLREVFESTLDLVGAHDVGET